MWNYKGLPETKIELSICRVIYLFDFGTVWDFMVMADGFLRFRQSKAREIRLTGFFLFYFSFLLSVTPSELRLA